MVSTRVCGLVEESEVDADAIVIGTRYALDVVVMLVIVVSLLRSPATADETKAVESASRLVVGIPVKARGEVELFR